MTRRYFTVYSGSITGARRVPPAQNPSGKRQMDENDTRERDTTRTAFESTSVRRELDASEQPSFTVVETVSAATGKPPTDLDPLQRYVDVDALDGLVASSRLNGTPIRLSLSYDGAEVELTADSITVSLDP